MKIHKIKAIHEEPYFRKMKVESGYLYNFYDTEKDEYQKEWIFVIRPIYRRRQKGNI